MYWTRRLVARLVRIMFCILYALFCSAIFKIIFWLLLNILVLLYARTGFCIVFILFCLLYIYIDWRSVGHGLLHARSGLVLFVLALFKLLSVQKISISTRNYCRVWLVGFPVPLFSSLIFQRRLYLTLSSIKTFCSMRVSGNHYLLVPVCSPFWH